MRKLVIGFVFGVAAAVTATALGLPAAQSYLLRPGDSAYFDDVARFGQPTCQVVTKRGVPTFSCFVSSAGGELQKRFGVTINNNEVTVSQYFGPTSPKPYKIIFRRIQTHDFIAHR